MADGTARAPVRMRFDVTVSRDERFRALLDALVSRMIDYAGYDGDEARAASHVILRTLAGARACTAGAPDGRLDVRFLICEREMKVGIACRPAPDAPREGGWAIPGAMRAAGPPGADLGALEAVANRLLRTEFEREDGRETCTLAMDLPGRD